MHALAPKLRHCPLLMASRLPRFYSESSSNLEIKLANLFIQCKRVPVNEKNLPFGAAVLSGLAGSNWQRLTGMRMRIGGANKCLPAGIENDWSGDVRG
jgi:hypothetical protein